MSLLPTEIKYDGSNQDAVLKDLKKASEAGMKIIHTYGKENMPVLIAPGKKISADAEKIELQLNYVEYANGEIKGRCNGRLFQTISPEDTLYIGNRADIKIKFEELKEEWKKKRAE